jgi:phosphoglucomutase
MTEKDVANGTNGVRMSSEVEKKIQEHHIQTIYSLLCEMEKHQATYMY